MKDCVTCNIAKSAKVIPGNTGTILVKNVLGTAGVFDAFRAVQRGSRGPEQTYSDRCILNLATASFAAGNSDFIDINEFRDAARFYGKFLGANGQIPSETTVRTRLEEIAARMSGSDFRVLNDANIRMLKVHKADPGALPNGMVPLDVDVSPHDNSGSHKEGIGRTYKGCDGFAPMYMYLGIRGIIVGVEMRPGTQNGQKGTPALLARVLKDALELTDRIILVRFDCGHDARVNIEMLIDNPRVRMLVKRNFRSVRKEPEALRLMQIATKVENPRPGKLVYTGSTTKASWFEGEKGAEPMSVRAVFQITERTITPYGQYLLEPDIEIDMWYTTLSEKEATDDEVIELYHSHASCEQCHSEIKTDLDLERFPSGKYAVNGLILQLAAIGFNALKIMEMIAREMPAGSPIHFRDTMRRRIGTIVERLIRIPAVITFHARKMTIDLGCCNPWADVFLYVDRRIREAA